MHMHRSVEQLTPDYTQSLGAVANSNFFGASFVEAPSLFKRSETGVYYAVFGSCCCYCEVRDWRALLWRACAMYMRVCAHVQCVLNYVRVSFGSECGFCRCVLGPSSTGPVDHGQHHHHGCNCAGSADQCASVLHVRPVSGVPVAGT